MTNYMHVIKESYYQRVAPTLESDEAEESPFEPAPCDDCKSYDYCAENEAACLDFWRYANTGKIINSKRDPSRAIYNRVFRRSAYGGT